MHYFSTNNAEIWLFGDDIVTKKREKGEKKAYLDFCYLTAHAQGVISDSGNVAEEATFNGVPCITLNDYTEHIETVKVGTNELVGEDAEILAAMLQKIFKGEWKKAGIPDRWDGRSAERILQILCD